VWAAYIRFDKVMRLLAVRLKVPGMIEEEVPTLLKVMSCAETTVKLWSGVMSEMVMGIERSPAPAVMVKGKVPFTSLPIVILPPAEFKETAPRS